MSTRVDRWIKRRATVKNVEALYQLKERLVWIFEILPDRGERWHFSTVNLEWLKPGLPAEAQTLEAMLQRWPTVRDEKMPDGSVMRLRNMLTGAIIVLS